MGRNRLSDELKKRVHERDDYSIIMIPNVQPYKSIAEKIYKNSANIQTSVDHIKRKAVEAYYTNNTVLMDACVNEIIKLAKNTRKSIMVSDNLCIRAIYTIDELRTQQEQSHMMFYNGIPTRVIENPYKKLQYGVNTEFHNEPAIDALVAITKYYVDKYSAQNRMDLVRKTVSKLRNLSIKLNLPIYVNMEKKYFIEMKGE